MKTEYYKTTDGLINQCNEELAELIQALCKFNRTNNQDVTARKRTTTFEVSEELADVEICIAKVQNRFRQLKEIYGIEQMVKDIKHEKEQRTERLIEQAKGE